MVAAVSGGADSTALLLCLSELASEYRLVITVAHLNHRIRGTEGDADEDFVRRISAELGLRFISETIDAVHQAKAARQNLEDFARRKRYDFLRRTARQVGAQKIAVAHNLNDQAETLLLRLMRGSGYEGLSGIHPVVDGLIIRPLFECSRNSILEYLKQRRISYREDSTNRDIRYSRNRIRSELLPYLEEHFNPRIVRTLAREAGLARELWVFVESKAERIYSTLAKGIESGISLPVKELVELHPAMQRLVLLHAFRECLGTRRGITSIHLENALLLCNAGQSGNRIQMPRGSIALRQFGDLLLLRREPALNPGFTYDLPVPGNCMVPEAGAEFRAEKCRTPDLGEIREKSQVSAYLEPTVLPSNLIVRSRVPGDRYGGPGHRKVKKMLIDRKIPGPERSILPMLAVGINNVVWIPGFSPARAYQAVSNSETCIMIKVHRTDENI